ncbi:hypothetical protein AGDE_11499 [Angomonas deanei]|uniref:RanBP2-type domain-containing protein n=1 Tax=Angomonas deanei TaxID=59799 RepID=A0A7G2CW07_9TRYP|nr:hypothetical protein AGDE_11499 [Angomonas deanei]CAD2222502.1 hypothetical protein, conserved [Angomonas deanei]|eukprot:EPY26183.1 hypothetical protein AGDE_11499 [Angomonas deanei]
MPRYSDFSSFIAADLTDSIPPSSNGLTTSNALSDSVDFSKNPASFILNHFNSPVWRPVLGIMGRRNYLSTSDRNRAIRAAPSFEFGNLLMQPAENDTVLDEEQVQPREEHPLSNLRPSGEVASYTVEALVTAPPTAWLEVVTYLLKEHEGVSDFPLTYIPLWHEMLFKISSNPWLNTDSGKLTEAHRYLSKVVRLFYDTMNTIQERVEPPSRNEGGKKIITRLPPIIVRRWRKQYRTHSCLQLFGDLFLICVEGEERILCTLRNALGPSLKGEHAFRLTYSTSLLNDDELWLFFVTIPGRRCSNKSHEEQWSMTLQFTKLAVSYLLLKNVTTDDSLQGGPFDLASTKEAFQKCINVCMWIKNDNKEGYRCMECIRHLMDSFFDTALSCCLDPQTTSAVAWQLLADLRAVSLETMWSKTEKVHYGSLSGYFDVCTVATSVDSLRQERDHISKESIHLLFHPEKDTMRTMWEALGDNTTASRKASLYGLVNTGYDLFVKVNQLKQSNRNATRSINRFSKELENWTTMIGQPLRLSYKQIYPLWVLRAEKDSLHLANTTAEACDTSSRWACGCGFENWDCAQTSCTACVSNEMVRFSWSCSSCQWKNTSGVEVPYCLGCGSPHPSRAGDASMIQSGHEACAHSSTRVAEECEVCTDCGEVLRGAAADVLYYFCNGCKEYSLSGPTSSSCKKCCHSSSGYTRGSFVWQCGCGKQNSPLRRYCWSCSWCEQAPKAQCTECKQLLNPQEEACSKCSYPHPADHSSLTNGRVVECPGCHQLIPSNSKECHTCHSKTSYLVGPFVESFADKWWTCHHCGEHNSIRGEDGKLLSAKRLDMHSCSTCSTKRPSTIFFEEGKCWSCDTCGEANNTGFSCKVCLSLAPGISLRTVHVWACHCCGQQCPSWESGCTTQGCIGAQTDSTERHVYTPYRCNCDETNLTRSVPCAKCHEVPQMELPLTLQNDTTPVNPPAVKISTHYPDSGSCSETPSSRLDAVESLLLSASPSALEKAGYSTAAKHLKLPNVHMPAKGDEKTLHSIVNLLPLIFFLNLFFFCF